MAGKNFRPRGNPRNPRFGICSKLDRLKSFSTITGAGSNLFTLNPEGEPARIIVQETTYEKRLRGAIARPGVSRRSLLKAGVYRRQPPVAMGQSAESLAETQAQGQSKARQADQQSRTARRIDYSVTNNISARNLIL